MKNELISIVPNNKFQHSQSLPGIYYEAGVAKIAISSSRFGTYPIDDTRTKEKNPNPYDLKFQHTTGRMNYTFDCTFTPSGGTEETRANGRMIKEFYEKHPQTTINGKYHANTKSPQFDIVYLKQEEDSKADEWTDALKTAFFIEEQTVDELCNMVVYFGDNPNEKSKIELKTCLIGQDYRSGLLGNEKNKIDFRRTFLEKKNLQYDIIIAIRKAMNFKVISTPIESGKKVYRYSDSVIGMNEADCISFFQNNPVLYESLQRAIGKLSYNVKFNDAPKEEVKEAPFKKKKADEA